MNPMGGIDQQITQRAARMKNDPNALMQQYGQSKNILDLIAAQRAAEKVQKEKQLAALQMQGNPPTVADQLEQTIIAAEKEKMAPDLAGMKNLRDRTKGVAGVLAQKQRQQQKRMQQMGQQPQRPQQQPQQQRPQGQPTMAATGGSIVGLAEGGEPTSTSRPSWMITPEERIVSDGRLLAEGQITKKEAMLRAARQFGSAETVEELDALKWAWYNNVGQDLLRAYGQTTDGSEEAKLLRGAVDDEAKQIMQKVDSFKFGDDSAEFYNFGRSKPKMAGGGLLSQRAPNLERMYNGGIVGYNVGGRVQALIDEYRKNTAGARNLSDEEILAQIKTARPTNVEEYRKKVYGSSDKSDAQIQQAIDESFSGKLKTAESLDAATRQREEGIEARLLGEPTKVERARAAAPVRQPILDPMAGMVSDTVTAEPLESTLPLATEKITQEEVVTAAAREPDVAAAAVEEVEAPLSVQEQMDAALAQQEPVRPEGMMFDPEVMQAGRQQATDKAAKEQFGRNAASLGLGGMSIKPLEKMTQAPELLRRRPNTPLTLEQEYEALQRKQLADLKKDETGLTDTRSNTRRLLDRLTDAAINASKRPAATSNRGALASFGLGISEAVRAEEKERKEGLAGIRERRNALLKAREDRELAKAQISQGQQRVDTLGKQLEQDQAQFEQRIEAQSDQFKQTMRLKTDELASTSALNIIKAQSKSDYDTAMLAVRTAEANAQAAFNASRVEQGSQELRLNAANAVSKYNAKLEEVQREAIDALSFNPQFKGNPEALKAAEKGIRLEFTKLKNAKKTEFAALGSGSSGLSESSEAALASLGI